MIAKRTNGGFYSRVDEKICLGAVFRAIHLVSKRNSFFLSLFLVFLVFPAMNPVILLTRMHACCEDGFCRYQELYTEGLSI